MLGSGLDGQDARDRRARADRPRGRAPRRGVRDAGRLREPPADRRRPGSGSSWRSCSARADVVSLHCPLTPETRHLIDAQALAAMRPSAVLVNTTRGPVVDEAALVDALRAGRSPARRSTSTSASPRCTPGCSSSSRSCSPPPRQRHRRDPRRDGTALRRGARGRAARRPLPRERSRPGRLAGRAVSLPAGLARELEAAVGADGVIGELDERRTYECDGLTSHRVVPELVVLPRSAEQVQAAVRLCHAHRVPFVARGAGTGLSGGARALRRRDRDLARAPEPDPRGRPRERADRRRAGRDEQRGHAGGRRRTGSTTRPTRRASTSARSAATSPRTRAARTASSTGSPSTT